MKAGQPFALECPPLSARATARSGQGRPLGDTGFDSQPDANDGPAVSNIRFVIWITNGKEAQHYQVHRCRDDSWHRRGLRLP
ncbi:hypothetical protein F01_420062 [Burkholderia cenocepacia]|nr:hypothetical protein F01_420062 [Burkholderia cenocepacia]